MVTEILIFILTVACTFGIGFIALLNMRQFEKERSEWQAERSKLLDRIQSGGLAEFKAQERADTPIIRREKDPLVAKLESEPWL